MVHPTSERADQVDALRTHCDIQQRDQTIRADSDQLRDEGNLSTALAFRDPSVLDFLELQKTYSERDLKFAILAELQQTLVELGTDFAFVTRQ